MELPEGFIRNVRIKMWKLVLLYLLLVVTRTPFSVEKASEGSPWMFQSLTTVGLPRNAAKEKSGVQGIHS